MTNEKPSNPKDAVGVTKVPFSVLPVPVLAEAALGLLEGALKYGRHNYHAISVRASVYYDATLRHLNAWWEGEDLDEESGAELHHISKAISSLLVLRDAQLRGMVTDDRPPSTVGFMKTLNPKVKQLLAKYPNPVPAYTIDSPTPILI